MAIQRYYTVKYSIICEIFTVFCADAGTLKQKFGYFCSLKNYIPYAKILSSEVSNEKVTEKEGNIHVYRFLL